MASRNKREGGYCGKWGDFKNKHHRVGNQERDYADVKASLKQMAKWNKGDK